MNPNNQTITFTAETKVHEVRGIKFLKIEESPYMRKQFFFRIDTFMPYIYLGEEKDLKPTNLIEGLIEGLIDINNIDDCTVICGNIYCSANLYAIVMFSIMATVLQLDSKLEIETKEQKIDCLKRYEKISLETISSHLKDLKEIYKSVAQVIKLKEKENDKP